MVSGLLSDSVEPGGIWKFSESGSSEGVDAQEHKTNIKVDSANNFMGVVVISVGRSYMVMCY